MSRSPGPRSAGSVALADCGERQSRVGVCVPLRRIVRSQRPPRCAVAARHARRARRDAMRARHVRVVVGVDDVGAIEAVVIVPYPWREAEPPAPCFGC